MPQRSYPYQFGPPHRIETAQPLVDSQVMAVVSSRAEGVTLEVALPGIGAGYLFHIERAGAEYWLRSFKGDRLAPFRDIRSLTSFINHSSGLRFDADSWRLSEELNRRIEPPDADEPSETED